MAIQQVTTLSPGLVGVYPRLIYIATNDTLATVTTTGYLNSFNKLNPGQLIDADMALVVTKLTPSAVDADSGFLQVNFSSGNWSLIQTNSPGTVVLPTIANHIATYTNTTGGLSEDPATAISGGNIQAGLSGTAGFLASFPSAASKGSLRLTAVANTGNTLTTISNAAMGQASVFTIPDPAAATANFAVAPSALVNNNLVKASGTAGLVVDAGIVTTAVMQTTAVNTMSGSGQIILVKANGTEAANAVTASGNAGVITTSSLTTAGGATYAITWTNTKITATSVIALTIQGGTNTVQNITFECVPGSGTATLTIFNNTAATALDGTILIGYIVL